MARVLYIVEMYKGRYNDFSIPSCANLTHAVGCREALGRKEDALADFESALQIQPANKEAADKVQTYIQGLEGNADSQ